MLVITHRKTLNPTRFVQSSNLKCELDIQPRSSVVPCQDTSDSTGKWELSQSPCMKYGQLDYRLAASLMLLQSECADSMGCQLLPGVLHTIWHWPRVEDDRPRVGALAVPLYCNQQKRLDNYAVTELCRVTRLSSRCQPF